MYRLLIIEDDKGIAEAIRTQAQMWDLDVYCITDFHNVMAEFAECNPHIVLLDIALPFFNGYHWCNEIRKVSKVPIIFISSATDNMNMIMAMNMGADDFIAKPFDQSVLMAKLQALLRRTYDFGASVPVLEHKGALLNIGESTLTYGDEKLSLSKNEFRILLSLMESKESRKVNAFLPKFSYEYGKSIVDELSNMGMGLAFNPMSADFSNIGDGALCIGDVVHKTFIQVDANGTKAGAATKVDIMKNSIDMNDNKVVRLDRPFVYMIIDNATNLPIFMGATMEIQN